MKFIKKQLLRSWDIIKHYWEDLFFDLIDHMDLTIFGKYLIGGVLAIFLIIWTAIIIVLLPLILISFKYDGA